VNAKKAHNLNNGQVDHIKKDSELAGPVRTGIFLCTTIKTNTLPRGENSTADHGSQPTAFTGKERVQFEKKRTYCIAAKREGEGRQDSYDPRGPGRHFLEGDNPGKGVNFFFKKERSSTSENKRGIKEKGRDTQEKGRLGGPIYKQQRKVARTENCSRV